MNAASAVQRAVESAPKARARGTAPHRSKTEATRPTPACCDPEAEFMQAMSDYKQRSGRMFPTWSEVLEVLRDLGYSKASAV
jgi:hypothetical protein